MSDYLIVFWIALLSLTPLLPAQASDTTGDVNESTVELPIGMNATDNSTPPGEIGQNVTFVESSRNSGQVYDYTTQAVVLVCAFVILIDLIRRRWV